MMEVENGDVLNLRVKLIEPEKRLNPGGFSEYNYLKKKGVYSKGYIYKRPELIGVKKELLLDLIINLKKKIINMIDRTVKEPERELIKALLIGERSGLPEDWKNIFEAAGASHLLAISGLHIGFILIMLVFITKLLKIKSPWEKILISVILILYIFISGARFSVIRAVLLSLLILWAPYFKRDIDLFNFLGFAAIINLIFNPYAIFHIGFQLSYILVIVLIKWTNIFKKISGKIFAASFSAQLGSIPLSAYYFNQITPIGIITNIWAIPLTGLIIFISFMGISIGLIFPIFMKISGKILGILFLILKSAMKLMVLIPGSNLEISSPFIISIIIIYILIYVFPDIYRQKAVPVLQKRDKKKIIIISLLILFIIISELLFPFLDHNLSITFLAVGQGDSILVKIPDNKYILIDGGGFEGLSSNKGKSVILPYLKNKGIKKLTAVVISHFDLDHALGIKAVLQERKVAMLVLPSGFEKNKIALEILSLAKDKGIPVITVNREDEFIYNNLKINILNPEEGHYYENRNNRSIVIKLDYINFSILLTGDLEEKGENKLLQKDINLKSNILKLGHHGSGGSSSLTFLKEISPDIAIISVGKNNYGHPSISVFKRLKILNIKSLRTDRQGAITIKTNGYTYKILTYLK